jgi:UDP-N-acetylmuramate dehydrogenase
MNAGCYTQETKDVLVEAYALTRTGEPRTLTVKDMGFSYRKSAAAAAGDLIFTGALFRGVPDDAAEVTRRMEIVTARREASQPIREKTGGSTFKNPHGQSAWQLVDRAGWRGRRLGGAMFSPQHANFLINTGEATAADLEALVEAVRTDVKLKFRVQLEWEIKRIGRRLEP